MRDYLADARRIDGSRIAVLLNARAVRGDDGAIERIEGTVLDFTARKAAEDEVGRLNAELEQRVLDRTAELDGANRELEAFAYSVSHDLRAPLRHISGFSALLAERSAGRLDEKSRHYIEVISTSVLQMGVLIDDLLQFSRTGRAELHIEPVDMDATLAEALEPLKRETDGRDVEWTIRPLPQVVADRALLRQVWANLVDNAVKYTRGRVAGDDRDRRRRRERRVRVLRARQRRRLRHAVRAQALRGLPAPAQRRRVRGHRHRARQRQAHRHQARRRACGPRPNLDEGATFYFSLPDRKEPHRDRASTRTSCSPRTTPTTWSSRSRRWPSTTWPTG